MLGDRGHRRRGVAVARRCGTAGLDPLHFRHDRRAKGATFTHENIAFNALNVLTVFGVTPADEILTAVPMFHAGGLLIHTMPGLCAGATITIHRGFDPGELLDEIQRQRITLLACVLATTFALASHPGWDGADLSSLRLVVTGSTMVPRRAIEPWQRKGVSIVQGYGGTETCPTARSNVYPSDLETVLSDCAEIREAAVVGRPDDELGEVPVACVVPTPGHTLTTEQVIRLFENRLAAYKHPCEVICLDTLPLNWHGKVDRRRHMTSPQQRHLSTASAREGTIPPMSAVP
jgi:acyl-CoA synthetase (AMP-forming)/AMP-acid ligase II